MFLMTDAHVLDERFLVLVNDHLATGSLQIKYILMDLRQTNSLLVGHNV